MNATITNTPEHIEGFRLLTLKAGLSLEVKGMKHSRGQSCYSRIKNEFGLKGTKQSVYSQFIEVLKEKGIIER